MSKTPFDSKMYNEGYFDGFRGMPKRDLGSENYDNGHADGKIDRRHELQADNPDNE
jgi:hypothetical protein